MPKCKTCNGSGYNDLNVCSGCSEKDEVNPEKGYAELGLFVGIAVGIGTYLITLNFDTALLATVFTAIPATLLFRFFFRNIFPILVIGFILYFLFA